MTDDLIARLPRTDVIRDLAALPSSRRLVGQVDEALIACADWMDEAADRLAHLEAKVARLTRENDCLQARIKQLAYPCSPHCDGYLHEQQLARKNARLTKERDEAYERAAKVADDAYYAEGLGWTPGAIAQKIRNLTEQT